MSLKDRIAAAFEHRQRIAEPGEVVNRAALARASGVKEPSVHAWFSGATKSLQGAVLMKAAAYLRVNPDYLAGNSPVMLLPGAAGIDPTSPNITHFAPVKTESCPISRSIRDRLVDVDPRLLGRVEQAIIDAIKEWELTEGEPGKKSAAGGGGHRPRRVPRRPSR